MAFKSVGKKIFSYSYKNNDSLIEKHVIDNLKLIYEYEIFFKSNHNPVNSSSYLSITLTDENKNHEKFDFLINSAYKFENKNMTTMDIKIILSENIDFSIYVLEKPIIFSEYKYENSPIINNFIHTIDENINLNKKLQPTFDIKVACIFDEFTYECFSYEVELLQLKSISWREDLEKFQPTLLMVESAWYGICNTWIGKIACEDNLDFTLSNLIHYCKSNGIPTVFFNKEGLVNFNYFKYSSSIFDYVFVSDENIIPYQKQICNHNKVYPLSFAAQPRIHNSIDKNKYKLGPVAFAGGWYSDKHLDRLNDFQYILKPALDFNVHIYDRNYHQRPMLEFINKYWPDIYLPYILGKLDYKYMVSAYKNYDLFLNVNSVQNSSYMISRRVYEILCCKTMILSSYSKGIYDNFRDYIFISHNIDDTVSFLNKINKSSILCDKLSKKSQRYILENHTYKARISHIFDIINVNYTSKKAVNVIVLVFLNDIQNVPTLAKVISSQQYSNISIVLLTPQSIKLNNSLDLLNFNNLNHYNYSNANDLKEIFTKIYVQNSYFAIINSNNYYGPNYIRDYVNIMSFVDFDVLGKSNVFDCQNNTVDIIKCDNKDSYVNYLYKDTLFFNSKYFNFLLQNTTILQENIIEKNDFVFYSDDEFNFICNFNKLSNVNLEDFII